MQIRRSPKGKKANPIPPLVFIVFLLMVLFSAIGLDYIGWKNEERSYLFSSLDRKKKAPLSEEALDQIVMKSLSSLRISYDSIQQYRDKKGIIHLMIDLPLKKYGELESLLEKEFKKASASILEREEHQGEERNYNLWQVEGKGKQRLTILFSCQKEKLKEALPSRKARNKVAIIIDDMGYSIKAINDICSFKKPLTVSILPHSPLAKETARIAYQNKLEVMLHLPLESVNNQEENNMEGIIHSQMSEEQIIKTMKTSLDQVPYASGVNNHMGSKITANKILMSIILENLKERNLFFVDSRTTSRSVACKVAQSLGIPSVSRHVFLDGQNRENYIRGKIIELFRLAQKKGKAVGICHPTEKTLKVLKENFHLLEKYNLEPVLASQIVR